MTSPAPARRTIVLALASTVVMVAGWVTLGRIGGLAMAIKFGRNPVGPGIALVLGAVAAWLGVRFWRWADRRCGGERRWRRRLRAALAGVAVVPVVAFAVLIAVPPPGGRPREIKPGIRYWEGYGRRPRVLYEINGHGFRDVERPAGAVARRVLVTGDSFVYGGGVAFADTLGQQLERRLRDRVGRDVEVYNLGVEGANLESMAAAAERMVPLVGADALVVAYLGPENLTTFDRPTLEANKGRLARYAFLAGVFGHDTASGILMSSGASQGVLAAGLARLERLAGRHGFAVTVVCRWNCARALALPQAPWLRRLDPEVPNREMRHFSLPGDGHPSAGGNAHVAGRIAAALTAELAARPPRPRPGAPAAATTPASRPVAGPAAPPPRAPRE